MLDNDVSKKQQIPQFQAMSQMQAANSGQQPNMQAVNLECSLSTIQD